MNPHTLADTVYRWLAGPKTGERVPVTIDVGDEWIFVEITNAELEVNEYGSNLPADHELRLEADTYEVVEK